MSDIVERLRRWDDLWGPKTSRPRNAGEMICLEAAQEIERLRVMASEEPKANVRLSEENDRLLDEIERLREALKKIITSPDAIVRDIARAAIAKATERTE